MFPQSITLADFYSKQPQKKTRDKSWLKSESPELILILHLQGLLSICAKNILLANVELKIIPTSHLT